MDESFIEDVEDQQYESKRTAIKETTKSFWVSSHGKILVVWTLTVTFVAVIYILMPS